MRALICKLLGHRVGRIISMALRIRAEGIMRETTFECGRCGAPLVQETLNARL